MAELKRPVIKNIRDFIKKDYKLRDFCYICKTTEQLELHHLYGLSELFNTWREKNKIPEVTTVEQIKNLRVTFSVDCADLLSADNLVTLCGKHHKQLHTLYGQRYSNYMVPKVKNWIEIQKEKHGR